MSYSPELQKLEDGIAAAQRQTDDAEKELEFLETRLGQAQVDAQILKRAIGEIVLTEVLPFLTFDDMPERVEQKIAPLRERLQSIVGE